MPDWTKPMSQTFEYYTVDPGTWKDVKKLSTVKSSTISRDSEAETLGSASFIVTDAIEECYIRTYLVTVQNGITERHVLGTHLAQTPSSKFNGRVKDITVDAYTPLLELKDNQPPIGYFIPENEVVMDWAYRLIREHARAPVTKCRSATLTNTNFVADTTDTWLSYISDLIANQVIEDENAETGARVTQYKFDLDETGQILFAPVQDIDSMQPRWTYTDDNSSILYPDISMERDLYGIPNVVEVIYSTTTANWVCRVENHDPDSPISIENRGREVTHRVINPAFPAAPHESQLEEYAKQLIKALSTLVCTISYTHGYCPVRVNDCVLLNYSRAGLDNVKAKIISQSIKCTPGCPVTEKAAYTISLLRPSFITVKK